MKSALPPLKPTRTSQEISNFHFVDLSHKLALIDKARITVTTIELNDIINELQQIYLNDIDVFKTFRQTLDIKRNQLKDDTSRYNSLEKSYQTLKSNTSIIKNLESSNISVKIKEMINSINEIDAERQSQHPPPMSVDPQTVINKKESDVLKFLHLKELNYREIESLVYLLKKRSLSVDKSDESIGGIHKEFGSVSNLIEYAEKLEKENAKLKNYEMKYIQDSMTKRRPFAHLSTLGNQSIILILQSEINSLFQYSEELSCPLSKEEGQNFESVCSDPGFHVEKEISFETESNDQISVSIDEALAIAKTQYEKLGSSDVLKCRLLPSDFPEAPTTQLDKLLKSNDEHLGGMRARHVSMHKNQLEIVELTHQILETLSEKRRLEHISAKIFMNLKDLNESHITLIEKQTLNRNTIDALNNVISIVGTSLVSPQPNQLLKNVVISHLTLLAQPTDNAANNNNNNKKKKKKEILQQSSAFDLKPKRKLNPRLEILKNAKNDQLFSGLEMAINISDLDKERVETHFIHDLKCNIVALKTDFSKALNEMRDFLNQKIITLKTADDNVLRKTYFNKEIQAKLSVKGDQLCQTDESKVKKK